MFQRDYIMRLIEQLGQALIRILKLKEAEKFDAARVEINVAGRLFLGMEMELLRTLSAGEIIALLKAAGELDVGKCLVAAELLKEDADILERQGQSEAGVSLFGKSLALFLEAFLNSPQIRSQEYATKIDSLTAKLNAYRLPEEILAKQFRFYETVGNFAKAEDILFELLENNDREIAEMAIRFYEGLLQRTDEELTRGNLPRDEVKEGLRLCRQRFGI